MRRDPWMGDPPVETTRKVIARIRETDKEGSVFYVALGPDGQEVDRVLVEAKGALLAEIKAANEAADAQQAKEKTRADRLAELREKRRQGTALTAAEKNEALDLLLGV